jgi:hypothetical protein
VTGDIVLVLLGPQRFEPTLAEAMRSLAVRDSVAVVSAGWQERESEDSELEDHIGRETVDLKLYHRAEQVHAEDPALDRAIRARQSMLREVQELYRLRLTYELDAARELMARDGRGGLLGEHQRAAIRTVRTLDRWHLRRIRRIHDRFVEEWRPAERPAVARHRDQLARILERCGSICIAGGHVAVLLGRLRLFDLQSLIGERPVFAWSAGAMAVSDRIVLFHDSPPQGAGNPEILDAGLALCRGVILLPHASRRLRLDDPVRVSLFARRFTPATCIALERQSRLAWDGQRWDVREPTQRLDRRGRLLSAVGM